MSKGSREALERELGMAIRRNQNAVDAIDEAACERLGINRTDGRCLDIIQQHGTMTAGALAEATGLSPGAITTLLDRMEAAGYLRRVRDPQDRRKIQVEVTPEAERRIADVYGPIARWAAAEMGRHSEAQLRWMADFLQRGTSFLEDHGAKIRAATAAPKPAPKRRRHDP